MTTVSQTMKAIAIYRYGGPEVLQFIETPIPKPKSGEVLIRVSASGVNPADGKWRMGMFSQKVPQRFPYIPGYDVAGTVESAAELAVGSRVFAMLDNLRGGGYAQFAVVAEDAVAPIPDALDDVMAAALPTAALTGVQLIEEHIKPQPGERILITGVLGAVGRFALHRAKARGAVVIAAVRGSQRAAAMALGADEALSLDASAPAPLRLDHVADTVGGAAVAALSRHVRPTGKIRTVATTPIPTEELLSTPEFVAVRADRAVLSAIARDVAEKRIAVPIARAWPLRDAAEAHRLLETGGAGGKIILLGEAA